MKYQDKTSKFNTCAVASKKCKLGGWCSSCMYAYPGNAAISGKPKTFEEVKAWFEPNAEFEEEHGKWAEIEDIDDMKDYLVWEAQGMRPNWRIEDCEDD